VQRKINYSKNAIRFFYDEKRYTRWNYFIITALDILTLKLVQVLNTKTVLRWKQDVNLQRRVFCLAHYSLSSAAARWLRESKGICACVKWYHYSAAKHSPAVCECGPGSVVYSRRSRLECDGVLQSSTPRSHRQWVLVTERAVQMICGRWSSTRHTSRLAVSTRSVAWTDRCQSSVCSSVMSRHPSSSLGATQAHCGWRRGPPRLTGSFDGQSDARLDPTAPATARSAALLYRKSISRRRVVKTLWMLLLWC